jgi:hypothetical protein
MAIRMKNKLRARLNSVFIILAALVFIDELIKEGYGFDLQDLLSPSLTHEKIFIVFLALGLFFGWRKKKEYRKIDSS